MNDLGSGATVPLLELKQGKRMFPRKVMQRRRWCLAIDFTFSFTTIGIVKADRIVSFYGNAKRDARYDNYR